MKHLDLPDVIIILSFLEIFEGVNFFFFLNGSISDNIRIRP